MNLLPSKIAELSHDLQLGVSRTSIPDFGELPFIGMATILAIHIRGLGELKYSVLRQVADHYFDIPAMAIDRPIRILEEIGYVTTTSIGHTLDTITPNVPHFDSVFDGIGQYASETHFNEHEEVALAILDELSDKAENRDTLVNRLGAESRVFDRCESITTEGGLLVSKRSRGRTILVSPAYFSDNLDGLADMAAAGGASRIEKILGLVSKAQGWPLSMILAKGEVNGVKLTIEELSILKSLVGDGILKPPCIERPSKQSELFVFTPRPGSLKLNGSQREIYERAMALIAAMRKGQLLPEVYRIRSPYAILSRLKDSKFIGANSEALHQYKNLVSLHVGRLEHQHGSQYRFHLIETPENMQAIDEAISLLGGGNPTATGINQEAIISLTQGEQYIQSAISAAKFRKVDKTTLGAEEENEIQQMLMKL